MTRLILRLLATTLVLSVTASVVSHANLRYKRLFVTAYPKAKGTRLDVCLTCHVSPKGTVLNPYGADLKKAGLKFPAIEAADSDKDGASNRKEIDALTFPGDANDKPGAKPDSAAADSGGARPDRGGAKPDTGKAAPDTTR